MSETWQPISTAPDDGQRVWTWNARRPHKEPEPARAEGDWWRKAEAWGITGYPSHWLPMQLPAPPEPTDGGSDA